MNSIKEISSTVIAIKGMARLSEFRINSLKESLKNKENIHNLECREIYFISLNKKLSQDNLNKLNNILSALNKIAKENFHQNSRLPNE